MLVSQIMKKDCCSVMHTDLIEVAAKKMEEKHARTALVFEEGHISGVITEKEIKTALAAGPSNTELSPEGTIIMKGETAGDEGNRCCYFSDVKIDLLLEGMRV
ncbi:MAG TPA: CBS domain-containing protein [Nitrospirota bacterium]|nr:CBS domain-containing protein [Nitrospirota bacterium]